MSNKHQQEEDSLIAAIDGNDAGMSKDDLVLTVQMLRNGRKLWMDEAHQLRGERDTLIAAFDFLGVPKSELTTKLVIAKVHELKAELERVKAQNAALMDVARAAKKECDQFNFPDEDRPLLHDALVVARAKGIEIK